MDDDKINLRRYEDDLNVSGSGVIIMGIWENLRVIIQIFLGSDIADYLDISDPTGRIIGMIVFAVIFIVLMSSIVIIHLYIGLNAIKVSKGETYRKGYFAVAIIMLVFTVISMTGYKDMFKSERTGTFGASILVDLTTMYVLAIVIRSTYKIKKIKEKPMQE